jgi:hypothetical protein
MLRDTKIEPILANFGPKPKIFWILALLLHIDGIE